MSRNTSKSLKERRTPDVCTNWSNASDPYRGGLHSRGNAALCRVAENAPTMRSSSILCRGWSAYQCLCG
jgi:hypothetical protein